VERRHDASDLANLDGARTSVSGDGRQGSVRRHSPHDDEVVADSPILSDDVGHAKVHITG
jgi:hypothetical protein